MSKKNKSFRKRNASSKTSIKSSKLKKNKSLDMFVNEFSVLYQQGKVEEALKTVKLALIQFPQQAMLLENAGTLSMLVGDQQAALLYYQQCLKLNPNNPDIVNKVAYIFKSQGHYNEAEEWYKKALKLQPEFVDALYNLAVLFKQQQRYQEAEGAYKSVINYQPEYFAAYVNLALVLEQQQRYSEAEVYYQYALKLRPDSAEVCNNLGGLYLRQKLYQKAEVSYQQALKLSPDYLEVHFSLGHCYQEQSQLKQAESCFQHVLQIQPDHADAYFNLANNYAKLKHFEQAKNCFYKALELEPNFVDAHYNLSLLLLTLGDFNEGWQAYEFRYHPDKTDTTVCPPKFNIPQWQGESLINKSLFVWPEQGLGDELMFTSCLVDFKQVQGSVTLACASRLIKLFRRSFPHICVIEKDPDNQYLKLEDTMDYQCAIGSLPGFFRRNLEDFQKVSAYLKVDVGLFEKWKKRYKTLDYEFNIGVSWRGGGDEEVQRRRSIALIQWLPILKHKVNFINLQYGDHQAEIETFENKTGIHLYDWEDADPLQDLDNFAAQIKALDLVISIDNSTVHFSGALGVETFVMLPFSQEWRWMEGQESSYWYPKVMTLFKREVEGEWTRVINTVSQALSEKILTTHPIY